MSDPSEHFPPSRRLRPCIECDRGWIGELVGACPVCRGWGWVYWVGGLVVAINREVPCSP